MYWITKNRQPYLYKDHAEGESIGLELSAFSNHHIFYICRMSLERIEYFKALRGRLIHDLSVDLIEDMLENSIHTYDQVVEECERRDIIPPETYISNFEDLNNNDIILKNLNNKLKILKNGTGII